ncbi:MAG: peptidase domain-containing ABC transporter [Lentisphaerae bacterium]|nr:peptidase domain-containing ABC transporter [Lentisphaerota bacterium]
MSEISREQLLPRLSGRLIIFRQLQQIDACKHSGLFCLSAIARHHQIQADLPGLLRECASPEADVTLRQLQAMADNLQLRSRMLELPWKTLRRLGQAYPAIGQKKDGHYALLCGFREQQEKEELAVLDPAAQPQPEQSQFTYLTEEQYQEQFSARGLLLKPRRRWDHEQRPFGLFWFIPEFLKLKGVFFQICIAVFLLTLVALAIPLFFQNVVDRVLVHHSFSTLNVLGIGVVVAILFNALLEYLKGHLLLFATNKIDINTALKTFRHLLRLPLDFFEKIPAGVLLKHIQQTEKIRGFLSGNLFFTILELCSLAIFIPFLLLYSARLTAIVLLFTALMILTAALLIKPFQNRLNALYQAEGKRQSRLVEAIHGIGTVKTLALEPLEERKWSDASAAAIKAYFQVGRISLTAHSISQAWEMLLSIIVIWYGAILVFRGEISVGALIAFQMLSGRVSGPLVKIVGLIHEYQQIALSIRMLGAVMNTPQESNSGRSRQALQGRISFDKVCFAYRPGLPPAINNLSLEIPSGCTLGIVGRSGSGKTTLTKLILGLHQPQTGIIRIDGIDIREMEKSHLRSSIGVVLQENSFFRGSVRDNICLTKPGARPEEILYVSRLAGADEFIVKLPQGYDTILEENAANLSGGQRQRLAIARALLNNPAILVFDEATSALDPESERIFQNNLAAIARGRTVIIISHRLSMITAAQKILVLDQGQQSAWGSHQELLAQGGIYREFWQQQQGHAG